MPDFYCNWDMRGIIYAEINGTNVWHHFIAGICGRCGSGAADSVEQAVSIQEQACDRLAEICPVEIHFNPLATCALVCGIRSSNGCRSSQTSMFGMSLIGRSFARRQMVQQDPQTVPRTSRICFGKDVSSHLSPV